MSFGDCSGFNDEHVYYYLNQNSNQYRDLQLQLQHGQQLPYGPNAYKSHVKVANTGQKKKYKDSGVSNNSSTHAKPKSNQKRSRTDPLSGNDKNPKEFDRGGPQGLMSVNNQALPMENYASHQHNPFGTRDSRKNSSTHGTGVQNNDPVTPSSLIFNKNLLNSLRTNKDNTDFNLQSRKNYPGERSVTENQNSSLNGDRNFYNCDPHKQECLGNLNPGGPEDRQAAQIENMVNASTKKGKERKRSLDLVELLLKSRYMGPAQTPTPTANSKNNPMPIDKEKPKLNAAKANTLKSIQDLNLLAQIN